LHAKTKTSFSHGIKLLDSSYKNIDLENVSKIPTEPKQAVLHTKATKKHHTFKATRELRERLCIITSAALLSQPLEQNSYTQPFIGTPRWAHIKCK
jgi:hypothetical protein